MNSNELTYLVKDCQAGKREAQKAFYQHFFPLAMGICQRYLVSPDEAGAAMNEGFLKAFQKIGQQKDPSKIKGWLRKLMVNTAIDHLRKNKQYYLKEIGSEEVLGMADEEMILGNITSDEILQMVQELPPSYRMVFNLFVVEGYSHKEIAVRLGMTPGASRSLLTAANARLRKWIEQNYNSVTS